MNFRGFARMKVDSALIVLVADIPMKKLRDLL